MTTTPTFDRETVDAEDVAVLTSSSDPAHSAPQPEVMAALRYLIYSHELSTGSTQLPQMIAVVGASPGEGVTTVSRSLAEVLASERQSQVCWVDLGASDRAELTKVRRPPAISRVDDDLDATDSSDATGVHSSTPVPREADDVVESIRRGEPLPRPSLDELVDDLARDYRHVVFDTPPLLSRTDAIGFIRRADAYILVVRQGATSLAEVRRMREELRAIPSLGAVLNDRRRRTPKFVRRFVAE